MKADPILAEILDDLDDVFGRYIAFPSDHARHAVAAWVVHCWIIDAFDSTPRLAVLSPEKGSGKTRVMEVIELHVPNPLLTVNVSAAAMFRKVAEGNITLLLDEADTYLGAKVAKEHEELRGLVNAGHRRGAKALRATVAGKEIRVVEYPAFAPVALAGIGDLPDTVMDRSVIVAMRRRRADERVEAFRVRRAERAAADLAGRIEEWAARAVDRLEGTEPEMPPGITDRPADVWEPLIVIGDAAGDVWSTRIRDAAVALNAERAERDPSLGVQLLTDCRRAFGDSGGDRLTTEALIEALVGMDHAPWADLRGKPLDARGLARRIRKYDVRPGDHRFGDEVRKGYLREDFHDAWTRYLPPEADAGDNTGGGPVADVAHVAHAEPGRGDAARAVLPLTEDGVGGECLSTSQTVTNSGPETLLPPTSAQGQQGQHAHEGDVCARCNDAPAGSFSPLCVDCAAGPDDEFIEPL